MPTGLQTLLQNTVELSQELLLEAHLDGAILQINPAWTHLLGWSESELRGKTFFDLIHPDDLDKTREEVGRVAESACSFDARYRRKDGSYRWIAWKAVARGNILHAAGRDITAEKEAVAALRESREALHQLQKADSKGPGTKVLAHDFNNLMQSIVAALELVRKLVAAGRGGETERFIASAIGSAHRAAEMNQQYLDLSSAPATKTVDDQRS